MEYEKITNWEPSIGRGYFDGDSLEPIGLILKIGKKVYVTGYSENPEWIYKKGVPEFIIDNTYEVVSVDESLGEALIKPVTDQVTLDKIQGKVNRRKPWGCISIDI